MIRKYTFNLLFIVLATILIFPASSHASRLDGKKVIFIGNSFIYYGGCVIKGNQRKSDAGLFKKICELNGDNVTVTDCCYGGKNLSQFAVGGASPDLLRDLDLSSYDIVFFSEAGENPSAFWSRWNNLKKRFTKPNVEFYYLSHTYSYINNHNYIINNLDNFEDAGVKVLEWGRIATELYGGNKAPGNMTPKRQGKLSIPNSAVTYSKNSFIKNKGDSHHPNPLSGYMTAIMAYCAASQTLAQGMPYDFVNSVINLDSFISSHYSSSTATNMKKIFASEADMQGIQALIDICNLHGIFDYDVKYNGLYFKVDDVARVTCERYTRLTGDLTIPSTVDYNSKSYITKEITPYAFYAHSGLTSIAIPETVESIGNHAFQGCSSLKSVTCYATVPPQMPDDAFTTYTTTTLTVPAGTKALYASASGWRNFTNIIEDASTVDPGLGDEFLRSNKSSFTLSGGYGASKQPYIDIMITGSNLTTEITCNSSLGVVTALPLTGWNSLTGGVLRLTLNTNYESGIGSYSGVVAVQSSADHRIEIPFTVSLVEQAIIYTVNYNANDGSGTMAASSHTQGIESKLSSNTFTLSGCTFNGWHAHRASDDTWYYLLANGTTGWYKKGYQPAAAVLTTFANGATVSDMTNASAEEGDVITLYANWKHNATGTTTYYVQYDANGGSGSMAETTVIKGTSTQTTHNQFTREGYSFVGWTAFRHNSAQWATKNTTTWKDAWKTASSDWSGHIYKTYANGASISSTTSVDRDVVTFYANWARFADGDTPHTIIRGSDFELWGTLECTTDMYGVIIRIKDANGNVIQSYNQDTYDSRTTEGSGFDLSQANSIIDFSTLEVGTYTYEVVVQIIAGEVPREAVMHSSTFEVIDETSGDNDVILTATPTIANINAVVGQSASTTISVAGLHLDDDITLSLSGTDAAMFSLSTSTINQTITNETITVTYSPTVSGNHSAILTISSTGADDVIVELTGSAIDSGIIANDDISSLTEVWNFSEVSKQTAAWITTGAQVTQDFTYNDGKLYVVHHDGSNDKIFIVNATTGEYLGELPTTTCAEGTYVLSSIECLGDKIIASNLTADASADLLKVYIWDDDNSEPEVLLSTTNHNNVRVGDAMSTSGDLTNGKIWFAYGSQVYYYTITNGTAKTTPTVINLTKDGVAYTDVALAAQNITVMDDGSFWTATKEYTPAHFSASGVYIEDFSNQQIGNHQGTDVKLFSLGAKQYAIATTYLNKSDSSIAEGAFKLLNITDGISNAFSVGTYPTNGLGATRNISFRNSLCYSIDDTNLYIWVLIPFQGAACYKFQHNTTSGIDHLFPTNEEMPVQYFNLQGTPVTNPSSGLYIKVQGSTVTKVIIR